MLHLWELTGNATLHLPALALHSYTTSVINTRSIKYSENLI